MSAGYREGVGEVSAFMKKCDISIHNVAEMWPLPQFGHKSSTLATPLRHPCEGGGVEKLALYTNAYRSFWSFAIPNQSEKKSAQHKNKIVI